jgi:hypothetical protein
MGAVTTDIDEFYKNTFGADFSAFNPEQRKLTDTVVGALHTLPHARSRAQLDALAKAQLPADKGGLGADLTDPDTLRGLGIYSAYRAGMMPSEGGVISDLVRKKAIAAGVPVEKIEQVASDRQAQLKGWASQQLNRFAHYAAPTDKAQKTTGEASMEVKDKPKSDKPLTDPLAQPVPTATPPPPPPAGIAATGTEGAPAQVMMPPQAIAVDQTPIAQPIPDPGQPQPVQVQPELDPYRRNAMGVTGPAGVM